MLNRILLLSLVAAGSLLAAQTSQPLNVLFFAVDDLRPELRCYGHDTILTPNIDRIAAKGMAFKRAYCQQAVCSPSRSSLLTGTRPDTTKVWDLVTHFRTALPDVVTLPQHFKNSGYFVQGMGKIYHGGFDDPPSWSVPWQTPKASSYAKPENLALTKEKIQGEPDGKPAKKKNKKQSSQGPRGPAFESGEVPDNYYQDGKVAELAVATLREIKQKNQPFFLAVGFIKPHLPFVSPKKYWDLYDPAKIKLAPNPFAPKDAPPFALTDFGELRAYHGIPASGPIPDDMARQLKHGYYAAASYMDAQVGKVLDELGRLGFADNTIVILWGDHGWKLGEHGGWCKHSNFENDANAPLLISVPKQKTAGHTTDALVEFVDIYPSLAELTGLKLPAHLEGTSFAPVLENPNRPWKPAVFGQYPRSSGGQAIMGYSLRNDRYRFVGWLDRKDHSKVVALELYDHQKDPQENQNIANLPESEALVDNLLKQLRAGWQAARPK